MSLSLNETFLKFLFFKIPLKDMALTSQCIYKIEALNTLYIFPAFDKLPAAVQTLCESSPESIPWTGINVAGVTYSALTLARET